MLTKNGSSMICVDTTFLVDLWRERSLPQSPARDLLSGHPGEDFVVPAHAAGEFLDHARDAHCDGMLLGETRYHTYLEAEAYDIGLILPGHYASERFGMECLADVLTAEFLHLEVWASRSEYDPVKTI